MQEPNKKTEIQEILEIIKDNKAEIQSVSELVKDNKTEIQSVWEIVNFIKDQAASHADIDRMDGRIDSLDTKVGSLDVKVGSLDVKVGSLDVKICSLDGKVDSLAVKMVTKEYLDDKLADLRGDLVVLTRKEDVKVRTLVEIMKKKQLLSAEEANIILALEPFPQLAL